MSKNPFFRVEDFQNIEILIKGINVTSQIPLKDSEGIHLVELLPDGVWLDLPKHSCALGHTLSLQVFVNMPGSIETQLNATTPMEIVGRVEELEGDVNSRQKANFRFRQYPQEQWNKFTNLLSEKQNKINNLIRDTRK